MTRIIIVLHCSTRMKRTRRQKKTIFFHSSDRVYKGITISNKCMYVFIKYVTCARILYYHSSLDSLIISFLPSSSTSCCVLSGG